jgi:CRP/FNR family cyclic AMP-dependent transcriptional regulator
MASDNVQTYLSEHPFFQGMEPRHFKTLAGCASTVRFEDGQVIFRQRQPAEYFYLVRTGKVSVEIPSIVGSPITIQQLSGGDVLGWSWLFPPYQWHFDARAVGGPVEAVALDARCLRGKLDADADLGYALMKRFARVMMERLQAARMQMIDKCGEP